MRKLVVPIVLVASVVWLRPDTEGVWANAADECVDECEAGEPDCIEETCGPAEPVYVATTTCVPILSPCTGPSVLGTTGGYGSTSGGYTGGSCTPQVSQTCSVTTTLLTAPPRRRRRRANPMPGGSSTAPDTSSTAPPGQSGPDMLRDAQQELANNPLPEPTYTSVDWMRLGWLLPPDVRGLYNEQIQQLADLMHELQDRYQTLEDRIAGLDLMSPEEQMQAINDALVEAATGMPPAPVEMTPDEAITNSAQDNGQTRDEMEAAMQEQMRRLAGQLVDVMMRYYDMRESYQRWLNEQMQKLLSAPRPDAGPFPM